jgi:CubicO group peptidase (beta-lactamase class C family)
VTVLTRVLLAALISLAPVIVHAQQWPTSSPEAQGMSSQELTKLVDFGIGNGMDSLLVARHGTIVAEAYYAPFAPATKHRINSSTKSVIGSLVAIALDEGLIKSLDQPVLDFFPGSTFANTDDRKKAMTLRHLLDMTSGLDWKEPLDNTPPVSFFEMERSKDWVRYVLDRPMAHDPGTTFDYNSGNPHLLSAILSKVTRRSARDYAEEKLFGPLGIDDVQWRSDPQQVSAGGAGLYLQPRDMARLGRLWLQDGVWKGKRLLPAGWIDQARHAKVDMGQGPELRYGNLFWSLPARDVFMSVGYDRQLIVVMPKIDVVAVFTGAYRYANALGVPSSPRYRLGQVIERVAAAAKSDAALPEDPGALAALVDKTKQVAVEARTESAGSSPMAATISGKTYRLQPNMAGIDTVSLTFKAGAASYSYESDRRHFGGPIGLDGLYAIGGRRQYGQSAAKGRWLDDKTFRLEVQTVGNDDAAAVTFSFDGKDVTLHAAFLLGFEVELKGTQDE